MRLLLLFLVASTISLAQKPNIIFIMSDDHDKDAISAYNKNLLQTPNIDRLAKEGMMFKKAFAANAICAPPERVSKNFFRNEKPITAGKSKI